MIYQYLCKIFLFGIVFLTIIVAQPNPHPIRRLTGEFALSCLEASKSKISKKCANYLGETAIGACDNEATTLCGDKELVEDITACLKENESKLSQDCLNNVFSNDKRWKIVQEQYRRITNMTSILSLIYLAIPLAIGIWTSVKSWKLIKSSKAVLDSFSSMNTSAVQRNDKTDTEKQIEEGDDSLKVHLTLEIGFIHINYWAHNPSTIISIISSKLSKSNQIPKSKHILRNICGEFTHSSITAIMGPSGSGKTTLLKLLAGQIHTGDFSGYRYLNKQLTSAEDYLKVIYSQGYVAQQDYFLESLTVWQTLKFAALIRIRDNISIEEKLIRAARIMTEMGLDSVAHVVLTENSGENSKGISGGQRRRLSIAQALLGNPQVLLLDEPTSGLDASNSLKLLKLLQSMSRRRKTTVALTIHQPRSEVFNLFDKLILLGVGGHMIYYGPAADSVKFISSCPSLRYTFKANDNPGDFIMDILGGENEDSQYERPIESSTSNPIESMQQLSRGIIGASKQVMNKAIQKTNTIRKKLSMTLHPNGNNGTDGYGEYEMVSMIDKPVRNAILHPSDAEMTSFDRFEYRDDYESLPHPVDEKDVVYDIESNDIASDQIYEERKDEIGYADDADLEASIEYDLSSSPINANEVANSGADVLKDHTPNSNEEITLTLNSLFLLSDYYSNLNRTYSAVVLPIKKRSKSKKVESDSVYFSVSIFNRLKCECFTSKSVTEYDNLEPTVKKILLSSQHPPLSKTSQLWVLFSRRVHTLWPTSKELATFIGQMLLIAVVTCFTFRYQVSTQLERPYQVFMVFVLISTYAMILQYLSLVPEYMNERKVILAENTANNVTFVSYILSSLLTEVPRALCQSAFFIGMIYLIRPVNPDHEKILFLFACLTVGICAWQSQIVVCSVITDQISHAYTLAFLVLGSGTLFGGLLLRLSKIPEIFKSFYFISVSAVTQRAIIVNDMQCCYLTATCNSLAKEIEQDRENMNQENSDTPNTSGNLRYRRNLRYESVFHDLTYWIDNSFSYFVLDDKSKLHETSVHDLSDITVPEPLEYYTTDNPRVLHSSLDSEGMYIQNDSTETTITTNTYCPPGLQITGDGSDQGNLGRLYLKFMGLDGDYPFFSLVILFWANIIFRILAIVILSMKKRYRYQLRYISSKEVVDDPTDSKTKSTIKLKTKKEKN